MRSALRRSAIGLAIPLIATLGAAGVLFGCSDDNTPPANQDSGKLIADLSVGDGPANINYPGGPYGTQKGEVISNLEFLAFKDPNTFCKLEKELTLDITKKVPLSFADLHNRKCDGAGTLAKPKQLLWVMVSAGWCAPCIQEITDLGKMIVAGAIDERVAFVDILFEDDDRKPATEAFAKIWADKLALRFPLLLDPTFKMGKFFDRAAVPFNMLVDLDTMTVYFATTGAAFALIGQQIDAFFKNK